MSAQKSNSFIAVITTRIRNSYLTILRDAHYSAWDLKIPNQRVVDGLTMQVQKAHGEEVCNLTARHKRASQIMIALGAELSARMAQFGLDPIKTPAKPETPRLSWSDLVEPFDTKETKYD